MCCVPLACLLYSARVGSRLDIVRSSEDSDTRLLFQVLVHGRDPPPNSGGASATVPLPAAAGEHSHTPSCDSGYASVLCLLLVGLSVSVSLAVLGRAAGLGYH